MKKITLVLLAVSFCAALTVNAQFTDNFEAYPLGTYHGGNWSSWSGSAGAEDIIVSSTFAFDGTKSGRIAGSTVQDAMLVFGNKTTGTYIFSFQAYIPTGKSGYMNFQGTTTASGGAGGGGMGVFNSPNLIFNNTQSASGAPGSGGAYPNVDDPAPTYTWQYPQSTWFPISIEFDIDAGLWTMSINGVALPTQAFDAENVLGGIDFYSFDPNNDMYIDAISFQNALSVDENNLNTFNAYPNPVKDILHISTTSVVDLIEVYDVLGQNVLTYKPASISPEINMSNLSTGAYFVKASIGNQIKTIKIIK